MRKPVLLEFQMEQWTAKHNSRYELLTRKKKRIGKMFRDDIKSKKLAQNLGKWQVEYKKLIIYSIKEIFLRIIYENLKLINSVLNKPFFLFSQAREMHRWTKLLILKCELMTAKEVRNGPDVLSEIYMSQPLCVLFPLVITQLVHIPY